MKFWNYVMLSIGLSLLFEMAGIPVATKVISYFGVDVASGFNLKNSLLYTGILTGAGILALTGTALLGITIGTLTRTSPENYILLPMIVTGSAIFVIPFYSIVTTVFNNPYPYWIKGIILFICALLGGGFMISVYEHWRGTD